MSKTKSFLNYFFITIAIVLLSKISFNFLALKFIKSVWGLETLEIYNDLQSGKFNYVYAHKFLALFDQIGTFLLPSIIIFYFLKFNHPRFITPKNNDYLKLLYFLIILIGITQILVHFSTYFNNKILPNSFYNYLQKQQEFNISLQEKFVGKSFLNFTFNIFLLAVIPAIGEELFFRALIQKIFKGIFKNYILGIVITSLIFGLLHFQIDNLIAIIFASIIFGFIYEKSENILLTIILHFCFNLFALINMQAIKLEIIEENEIYNFGNYFLIPFSVVMLIYVYKKKIFWR